MAARKSGLPPNMYWRTENGKQVIYSRFQVNGKPDRRSLRTASIAVARRKIKSIQEEIETKRDEVFFGERHSYMSAVIQWSEEFPAQVKPSVFTRYLVSIRQLDPYLKGKFVDEITPRVINQYVRARRRETSNATIRRDLTALSRVLASCVSWGWLDENPARNFDRSIIRERRDRFVPIPAADFEAVLAVVPRMFGDVLRVLRYTGMRLDECLSLQRPALDLPAKQILLTNTKTGRPRIIPLDDPVCRQALPVLAKLPVHITSPYVFWHGKGERFQNFSSRFGAYRKRAGVHFRVHGLRHQFAIDYLAATKKLYRLRDIMGHASVKQTEAYSDYVDLGSSQESSHQEVLQ